MENVNRREDRPGGAWPGRALPSGPGAFDLLARAVAGAGYSWLTWDAETGQAQLWDPRGRLATAGLRDGEMALSRILERLCGERRSHAEQALLGEVEGSRDVALTCTATDDGGATAVLELRGQVVRDDAGAVRGTALLRDVSEEASREQKLRASLRRFRRAFESAPVAIVLTSPSDVLLDVNGAFERMTGYARDEVVGREARELGFWSSREEQDAVAERLGGEGAVLEPVEVRIRTKNGRVREVLLSATEGPLDHLGGYVKMMLDVTERRGSERKLVQAVREVMKDTSWFMHGLLEKMTELEGTRVDEASLADLTEREREVLSLVADGLSNRQIGERLGIASSTVRNYMNALYMKLGAESRAEAVVWARERGLGGE